MKVISVCNQKGGVGKTTISVNLAAGMALILGQENPETSRKILFLDLDPQAHGALTLAGGVHDAPAETTNNLGALLSGESNLPLMSIIRPAKIPTNGRNNLHFAPTSKKYMSIASKILESEADGQFRLDSLLEEITDGTYEYVIIDTPPSLKALTVNALVASDYVLVPMQMRSFSQASLMDVTSTIKMIQKRQNPKLKLMGVQPSMYVATQVGQRNWLHKLSEVIPRHVMPVISSRADVEYAIQRGLDIFSYMPPQNLNQIYSAHPSTREFYDLAKEIIKRAK